MRTRTFLLAVSAPLFLALTAGCDKDEPVIDDDGDGYTTLLDCDDGNFDVNPGATELVGDGIDNNCDGFIDAIDGDGDGWLGVGPGELDCDDTNADIYPEAPELCDGLDNDCDGTVDEDVELPTYYADADLDGFGDAATSVETCTPPEGYISDSSDCDDTNPAVRPSASELCDELDNDCNGEIDDGALDASPYYRDNDADSFGDENERIDTCAPPPGYADVAEDCDDDRADVFPGALELCNNDVDDDCDGVLDGCFQDLSTAWMRLDGPTSYGSAGMTWSVAGDADGDGLQDLWVAAPYEDTAGTDAGAVWLVRGPFAEGTRTIGEDGVGFTGNADEQLGRMMKGDVDLNSDGLPDVMISAPRIKSTSGANAVGAVYVQFGPFAGETAMPTGADLVIYGDAAWGRLGLGAFVADDVSGDGEPDLVLGATYRGPTDRKESGTLYVMNGPFTPDSRDVTEADLVIRGGVAYDHLGDRLTLGDLDGDGIQEIIIGIDEHDSVASDAGAIYLVYGGQSGEVDLATDALRLDGSASGDNFGRALALAGDLDGDGVSELIVGAPGYDDATAGADAGAVYVLSGASVAAGADLATSTLALIVGSAKSGGLGGAVAGGADLDGDGVNELFLGASNAGAQGEGEAYILRGSTRGLASANDALAIFLGEEISDSAGGTIDFLPDLNGGAGSWLGISATSADGVAADAGALYLLDGLTE
ncbi:hypothetical protein L6R49_07020 [Myxococcota bacterium]|nr:hypothetical protein [Myxococcota bacterium]